MAPVRKNTIQQLTHPIHPLTYFPTATIQFLCDGCKTLGTGPRYRCSTCDFALHEFCGTCPISFSSFMHPKHQLNLVIRKSQAARQRERVCDVCGLHVNGLFYRCKLCEFDVHQLCTKLPEHTRHPLHREHALRLQSSLPGSGWCIICQSACSSWGYSCEICGVDFHNQCLSNIAPLVCSNYTILAMPEPPPPSPPPPSATTATTRVYVNEGHAGSCYGEYHNVYDHLGQGSSTDGGKRCGG
ncbi:Cysteine/Histidine-rich C1 domain family protein [Quillaja saponaria]|uniref:Cysteine/Histidine-rich C1 domain family protein n=1 Tax=Quillaja saponaria TaxID=32244 RepID=A0AAD7P6Z8_QUISA|nr:Cysteine/Histidine-rich C1 domain family protein [Quillaja saponaria]